MSDDLHGYYRSEKTIAYTFLGLGAASAGAGVYLTQRPEAFSRGLGGSLVALGGLQALGAAFYAFQVDAQRSRYEAQLARDPASFKRDEGDHIQGTTSRFVVYRTAEVALALAGAGVAAYGFAANKDVWKGIGVGVASQALVFFVIDSFGVARAHDYEERVRRFQPAVSMHKGGASLSWEGRF